MSSVHARSRRSTLDNYRASSDAAPVRGGYRLLTHRPGQFDYHAAIGAE